MDFSPVSDTGHNDPNDRIDAIIPDAVFPKCRELGAFQRFANCTGVIKLSDAVVKEAQNALCGVDAELVQFSFG